MAGRRIGSWQPGPPVRAKAGRSEYENCICGHEWKWRLRPEPHPPAQQPLQTPGTPVRQFAGDGSPQLPARLLARLELAAQTSPPRPKRESEIGASVGFLPAA